MAEQVARAAIEFERQRTGHAPESVRVILSDDTLVITLYGALSPAEVAMAATPAGAPKVREFHRTLFAAASGPLRDEIKRITGVPPADDPVVGVFVTGTVVQVFLLAGSVPAGTWSGGGRRGDDAGILPHLVEPTRDAGRGVTGRETRLL